MVLGPGLQEDTDVGPLVRAAVRDGAAALIGGKRPDRERYYFEPTALVNVELRAAILGEDLLGPAIPIVTFESEMQAVAFANSTEHGLVGYVYTVDLARGLRVSEALEFGMFGLNRGLASDPAAPFGGSKQSAIDREGGHDARSTTSSRSTSPSSSERGSTPGRVPDGRTVTMVSRRRLPSAWQARLEFAGCAR